MKKILFVALFVIGSAVGQAQDFKVVTIVESIVPMGMGRSRIIEHQEPSDYTKFTSERTDGKKSKEKGAKRSEAKIGKFSETKLLNFYSGVGINFQNIASNDALITSKINEMTVSYTHLTLPTTPYV